MTMERRETEIRNLAIAAILLAACAQDAAGPPAATPRKYDGKCVLAGIEQVPAPVGQDQDAVVMVARYRLSDGAQAGGPWNLRFQVARAREHDLRLHIESHPEVLCDAGREPSTATPVHIDVPPFQGQRGTVDR